LFAGAAWGAVASGCSSNNDAGPGNGDAALTCPASIDLAIDAVCSHEGQDCPIGYTCSDFPQQSHCVCTKGKYVCTDATGATIAKGAQPECVTLPPGNSKECPASESVADGKKCLTSGLICYFPGVQCPENQEPFVDHCQCVGAADGGLAFHCEPQTCNPRSDASDDAFSPPPPPDTGPPPSDGGNG
jgi:hypothetical protein